MAVNIVEQIMRTERVCPRILESHARQLGDKVFLYFEDSSYTFKEMDLFANRIGNSFSDMNVKKGEHVLIMMTNCPEFVFTWLGLTKIGAIEVPVNTAYKGNMLRYIINNSDAKVMVIGSQFLEMLQFVQDELETLEKIIIYDEESRNISDLPQTRFETVPFTQLLEGSTIKPEVELKGSDLMAIMYTSGTTGASKGVMVSYHHAYSYCAPEFNGVGPSDTLYVSLPLFHIGGQWAGIYASLIKGAGVALVRRFSASNFWPEIKKYNCTYTMILGAMGSFLFRQPVQPDEIDNPLTRAGVVPALFGKELEDFERRFGIVVTSGYGSTEASSPLWMAAEERKGKSCGKIRPDFEVILVDDEDNEVPIGQVGEACIRPKTPFSIMAGYYKMPEKTLEAWRNLWFHTGDSLYRDEEGYHYFVDRKKDAIRRRGENISSAEVEAEINAHPAVLECAALAVKSEYSEDEIKAVIVLKPGHSMEPEVLIQFLEPRMPYFMVPRFVEIVDSLPKTPTEKIQKEKLRAVGITENTWDMEKAGIKIKKIK